MNFYDFRDQAAPGDVYLVKRRMVGRLAAGGPWHDEETEGREAIVVSKEQRRFSGQVFTMRVLTTGRLFSYDWSDRGDVFELVRKGEGVCTPGIHYAFNEEELQAQRWVAFLAKLAAHDASHQGFVNLPTYLAWLYLNNESRWHAEAQRIRRKDGTVNPDKVFAAFRRLGLSVQPDAFECPIDVPAEFARRSLGALTPRINWEEVAANFKA